MGPNNPIFEYLQALARLELTEQQRAYHAQRLQDARAVRCSLMRDVFGPEQSTFLRVSYRPKIRECYKNASEFLRLTTKPAGAWWLFPQPIRYVEGIVYSDAAPIPIEHAFVKIGEKYIDPTFELALKEDPRDCLYVSFIELDRAEMTLLQAETGHYGDLSGYKFAKDNFPQMARYMRRYETRSDET